MYERLSEPTQRRGEGRGSGMVFNWGRKTRDIKRMMKRREERVEEGKR